MTDHVQRARNALLYEAHHRETTWPARAAELRAIAAALPAAAPAPSGDKMERVLLAYESALWGERFGEPITRGSFTEAAWEERMAAMAAALAAAGDA